MINRNFSMISTILSSIDTIDPCDEIICDGTNAVCQVVYGTGKPFCSCPQGFRGDPKVNCGKFFFLMMITSEKSIILSSSISIL